MKFTDFEKTARNLYKMGGRYYRLHGTGITPNGCWVINPVMVELKDIDIATGNDVYGERIVIDNIAGTVNHGHEYIREAVNA